MKCPKCKHTGYVRVCASVLIEVSEVGEIIKEPDHWEYGDNSKASCPECGHTGRLDVFTGETALTGEALLKLVLRGDLVMSQALAAAEVRAEEMDKGVDESTWEIPEDERKRIAGMIRRGVALLEKLMKEQDYA